MSAGSLFQKFDCKETVAGGGPRVQVCFYKMVGCELVYILRGKYRSSRRFQRQGY